MEERKIDPLQIIGFILIAGIITWMMYNNSQAREKALEAEQIEQDLQSRDSGPLITQGESSEGPASISDSLRQETISRSYGDLGDWFVPKEFDNLIIENEKLWIEVQPKGAQIVNLRLKEHENYLGEPLYLIKENNAYIDIRLTTVDGRVMHTREMHFIPSLRIENGAQVISFDSSPEGYESITIDYTLPKEGYILKLGIKSRGMSTRLSPQYSPEFVWRTQAFRNSRSIDYENRYTRLSYGYESRKDKKLGQKSKISKNVSDVRWIAYKQHFFSAILIPSRPLDRVAFVSENDARKDELNDRFTKTFTTATTLGDYGTELDQQFDFYYGPTDFYLLKSLDGDLENSIEMGWGIFGWINRFIFMPLFNFLSSYIPHGLAIILMTIIVRLAMSPVTYRSYVSQVKMRILKPEVQQISEKYKDNAVKKQQETMALYSKAGASPLSGCIPALLQLPVFYALFLFFPAAFSLREKSFLWADDLASYDSILDLGFNIPFYGDHVSLFPILASVAIYFYTRMTMSQQAMPTQPGMPNMKVLISIMPVFMLFFFNNYASGLSLYYFVSNLLTIILMLVIKNIIIDQEKVHVQIEEKKKRKPKPGGFSARLQKAMEEAERQKKNRKKR